tara:strand:- start:545 stop:742 length:198 start_codon:yes stop_codon:yes gene_type:complete
MRPPEVLKQLKQLREEYRKQSFSYTKEQKVEYDRLIKLRRERVKFMYDNGMVWKGAATKQNVEVT